MSTPLHTFSASFQTEDHLRQSLRTLLAKFPQVKGVEITHGSLELGKDLIFYAADFLGRMELHACVVKLKKIDGTVAKTGAREVLTQALQAFDSPHINTDGQEEYVTRVLIISPYDCSPATMNSIRGALKSRAGQVKFLGGNLLLDEFNRYWQDFLLFNSSALNSYVLSLARHLVSKDPINFILQAQQLLSGELDSLESRYVDQNFKKTFHPYEFTVDETPLTATALSGQLTLNQIKSHFARIADLTPLFCSPTLCRGFRHEDHVVRTQYVDKYHDQPAPWTTRSVSLFDAKKIADEVRDDVTMEWQQAALSAKKQVEEQRKKQSDSKLWPRVPTDFQLSTDWYDKRKKEFLSASAEIVNLRAIIAKANSFAEKPRRDQSIFDVGCSALSYVENLSREAPSFFHKIGTIPAIHLDREDLMKARSANLLITAPAGYGKTSFCKINAVRDAVALSQKKSKVIPVYVPLNTLATATLESDTVFLDLPELRGIMKEGNPALMPWNFYLDGLDEVPDPTQRDLLLASAKKVLTQLPLSRVVVTARTYISGAELLWLTRVELAELQVKDISLLADKWLPTATLFKKFKEQLTASPTLMRLCRVPLIATLTLAVFRKDPSIPKNRAALYKTFTELLCGGWDYVKGVNRDSRYGRQDKLRILVRFAGILHLNKLTLGSKKDLNRAVADVNGDLLQTFDHLCDELVEDGLIQVAGADFVFSHLSFQEYLASLEFGDPSGERNNAILLNYLRGDDWWREVISFYVAGPHRPDEMSRWIRGYAEKLREKYFSDGSREKYLLQSIKDAFPNYVTPKQSE